MNSLSENLNQVIQLTQKQLDHLFGITKEEQEICVLRAEAAFEKSMYCLSNSKNKYFDGKINPYNSVMYCIWLYWLNRAVYLGGGGILSDKIYYLNKVLNLVELFYEVELPAIWSCEHPLGSVMGRAKYGNGFVFYQGCTVGGNRREGNKIDYPIIGEGVVMYSNSKIVGKCKIGNNCVIAANSYLKDVVVPDNSFVFGQSPNLCIKEIKRN